MYPKFLVYSGPNFSFNVVKITKIPPLQNPGKIANHLRTIDTSLFSVVVISYWNNSYITGYKYTTTDPVIIAKQTGFRGERSYNDQVLSQTTFTEAGFEKHAKTAM